MGSAMSALDGFTPAVRSWFERSFAGPTEAQARAWPAISSGQHTLVLAPTGSGKTLAAFLWGLDRIATEPMPQRELRTRLVYVSPLRALAVDIEKNLRAPLQGIRLAAERLGTPLHEPTVGMRSGDTPSRDRRALIKHPPDILITTPESLYLMLTSSARDTLRGVRWVIVDEIHAMAATKRGSHLALSLERLEAITHTPPQRIGLSATQRPLDEIARFLAGFERPGVARPVTIVDAGISKTLDLEVIVPVEDMAALGEIMPASASDGFRSGPAAGGPHGPERASIWPAVHPRILELITQHRSTIIFVNARRLAERLASRLNELAGEELVRAHHGSLAREQRLLIEDELKAGRLRAIVATSSLELGIDMGAVDLVIQVASPGSVARGLQRVGRAGHQVGEPSRGRIFPKYRGDLLEAAVIVSRMRTGAIESTHYPRNPLDVLAQQIVAMCAIEPWAVDDLAALVRRAAPFEGLTDAVLENVLDLLDGRYPSEEFAGLRARLTWERQTPGVTPGLTVAEAGADSTRGPAPGAGLLRAGDGARGIAVTSGGTIPDRGLFGVFLPDGTRVGELDEEMVYESRPGETFLLGASTWRIDQITHERVVVVPAPGEQGRMPFWRGDGPGRPVELGRAIGAFTRELRDTMARPGGRGAALVRLQSDHGLDAWAAENLVAYLEDQAEATTTVPDDRTIVIERFRDEIGDWRLVVLTPFGARVHAPWAIAIEARLEERYDLVVQTMWSDDGIIVRLPDTTSLGENDGSGNGVDSFPMEELLVSPDEIEALVIGRLHSSPLFTTRFREAAARALLLPRNRPGRRTPLWQQRQRGADLLAVALHHPDFPILLEATRECIQDVFDVPALREVLADIESRRVRVVPVETRRASPFATSLLMAWVAVYMYEFDSPLAERRATALSLDRDLLRELLGSDELRELLDPQVLAAVELELQGLADDRQVDDVDGLHDLLRRVGDLSMMELSARAVAGAPVAAWVEGLITQRRAILVRVAGDDRVAAAEDGARLRDGLGVSIPVGLPATFTAEVTADDALRFLVGRYARTHGPFGADDAAARLGTTGPRDVAALAALERDGRVVHGLFRPSDAGPLTGVTSPGRTTAAPVAAGRTAAGRPALDITEWCDADVLRRIKGRTLASLRREVEPVEHAALARFLVSWHGIGSDRDGADSLVEVIEQLQGAVIPAGILENDVLPSRLPRYRPADLDALCAAGALVWMGAGSGQVVLAFRDRVRALAPEWAGGTGGTGGAVGDGVDAPSGPIHRALRSHLEARGASFWLELVSAAATVGTTDDTAVLDALWDLVWAGEVTNDTMAPLRARLAARPRTASNQRRAPKPRLGRLTRLGPPAAAGRWSLVAPLIEPRPSPTELTHARTWQLLERHGILTREATLAERLPGGFSGVYAVGRALEETGRVRRGYFVAGLGAAQFSLPGAVERLRAVREPAGASTTSTSAAKGAPVASVVTLAAADPAQPYGAALRWPECEGRPSRSAGAYVVLIDGRPAAFLERSGRAVTTFPDPHAEPSANSDPDNDGNGGGWVVELARLVETGRIAKLEVQRVDGVAVRESPWADRLRSVGFVDGYRGMVARR